MVVGELVQLLGFKVDKTGARDFETELNRIEGKANLAAGNIVRSFRHIGYGIAAFVGAAALAARPIAEAGDAMVTSLAKIESSIGRTATSAAVAAGIYDELYAVGQRTGVAADESASAFVRFNMAMKEMGRPSSDAIALLEGVQSSAIIAGTTTQELQAGLGQLGQALAKGVLSGDELVTFRETMPLLLKEMREELGLTGAELIEQAEKQLLTTARIVPALLKASENARAELANFPMSMARSFAIMRNSSTRFLAELDKQLKLSQTIARVFIWVAQTLDAWRGGLSVVGDLVREMGGLEGIARLVGIALGVAFGPTLVTMLLASQGAFLALGRSIITAFLPLAGFLAWVLVVEDFIGWIQGRKSLFGEKFGDFEGVIGPIKTKLEEFKNWFMGIPDAIAEAWKAGMVRMQPQIDWLIAAAGFIMDAFKPIASFFSDILDGIIAKFQGWYDAIARIINKVREMLPGSAPPVPDAPREDQPRRGGLNQGGRAGGFYEGAPEEAPPIFDPSFFAPLPDVSGRVSPAPANMRVEQNNEITINAPGADPASVAGAAQAGVNRATDRLGERASGNNGLALGLGMANPRVEAAAQ